MCVQMIATLAGAAVSAAGSMMAASQRSKAMKAQAKAQERQAEIESEAGAYRMSNKRRGQNRLLGSQIAATASNGISLRSGSATAAIDDSLTESERDIEATRYNAQRRSSSYKSQAAISRFNAKAEKTAGYFSALSPIIGAVGSIAKQYPK